MVIILAAFTLFHFCVGLASLGLGMRFLGAEERALWDSKLALIVAEILCWVYPVLALACASYAWRLHAVNDAYTVPLMLAPIGWLIFMGLVLAIVDFAEDGVLGNVRRRS